MRLQTQPRAQVAAQLGYLDDDGQLSLRAAAELLRAPLRRWGLSPKRAALRHARGQLRAVGVEDGGEVLRALQRLLALGEIQEVRVGEEACLAPAAPRWISAGGGSAAYLGVAALPDGVAALSGRHDDVVQRLRVDEDAATTLALAGVEEAPLAEWLTPLGYLQHARRRRASPATSASVSLAGFWSLLDDALVDEGLALGEDADVRCVAGQPGGFFGRHDAAQPGGRWTDTPGEGLWCAYRRGYNDRHWHPCVVAVTSGGRRALDLYDADEWRWALLARGRHTGPGERVCAVDGGLQLTFPAPAQLRAAMEILGPPSGRWSWEVQPDAPDLWGALL